MSSIPKVGDTYSALVCLYFNPQYNSLLLVTPPWLTPSPQFIACGEPFEVTTSITLDPVAGAIASLESAKNEATRQYTERVAGLNELQSKFLAIESDLADTVGDDNAQA